MLLQRHGCVSSWCVGFSSDLGSNIFVGPLRWVYNLRVCVTIYSSVIAMLCFCVVVTQCVSL